MKKQCLYLLQWVYTTDPDTIDVDESYSIPREEERFPSSVEEQMKFYGYALKNTGRRSSVSNLATILTGLSAESKHDMILLFVELSEADLYLRQHHVMPPISRVCSFLEHVLNERLDTDQKLSPVIREAHKEGELTQSETKLAQFIRHCRNDISHNFWNSTEWSYIVHNHAAISSITLLNSLLDSWYTPGWYVDNRLSMKRSIRIIEQEFELEWDDENVTYNGRTMNKKYDYRTDSAIASKTLEALEKML